MAIDPSIWIGPYLKISAKLEEVRIDRCQRKYDCVEPDPKKGRYCQACGLDLEGMYQEPSSRTEGHYEYVKRVSKDPREIIAGMEGYDIDSFAPGCEFLDAPPTDVNVESLTIIPNRGNWGFIHQRRTNTLLDLTDTNILGKLCRFKEHFDPVLVRLREEFDKVEVRYGMLLQWR